MKILHVINGLGMGGAESLLVELAPIQKEMGNDVQVLELKRAGDRTLADKLTTRGVPVLSLAQNRAVRNVKNIFSLIPYLKQCDVAHVHLFPSNYWMSLAKILSGSKTPIITTEHSTFNKRRKIAIFKFIDAFIYKHYNEVVACADKAQETFHKRFPMVHCISIPNGVNISKYTSALPYSKMELLGVPEDVFVITMVARFNYPKRQDTLVEAIAHLPQKFHVVFVGGTQDDTGLNKIKEMAGDFQVLERVHFLYLRSDVPRILKSSDVIVMSSEYEGLSLSSIEGMACGKPFIATNVNGLREVVAGAGELFKCGDANELVSLLLKFESDKNFYNGVVQRCLKRALEYDIYHVAEKYQKVYDRLLHK